MNNSLYTLDEWIWFELEIVEIHMNVFVSWKKYYLRIGAVGLEPTTNRL